MARLQNESAERRNKVKVIDRLRVKNEKLSEIEEEQRMKNDTLQRKAMMQLQENEEEIKRLNQVHCLETPAGTYPTKYALKHPQKLTQT